MRHKLTKDAIQRPQLGFQFTEFLLEYRPLQKKLAMHIRHASQAGTWQQQLLNSNVLKALTFPEDQQDFQPSFVWDKQRQALKGELHDYQQEQNVHAKKTAFVLVLRALQQLRSETLLESTLWRDYYLKALDTWLSEAEKEMAKLAMQTQFSEPITSNVYCSGEALHVGKDNQVFMGRTELKNELSRKIKTSAQMPMFLIQGQRRVGKSSLLHFLRELLGSGFRVVYQDCQSAQVSSIKHWLQDLHRRVHIELGLQETTWGVPDNWLQAWLELQNMLENCCPDENFKIILALDEYEVLHGYLQEDPKQGERLLAAMRSFSQQQSRVVFLFVGAALFSELQQPAWATKFVNAVRFKVDYLAGNEAKRLITEPVSLSYSDELLDEITALTQGHPALLQTLCSHMVDIANQNERRVMNQKDLDLAIDKIIDVGTLSITVFWQDFCVTHACQDVVRLIVAKQPVETNKSLYKLEEHGYIVPNGSGWKICVPLFQMWLKKFMDRV